jgi:hypothetical protein
MSHDLLSDALLTPIDDGTDNVPDPPSAPGEHYMRRRSQRTVDKPITLDNILALQCGCWPELALTTATPNSFAPLASSAPGTESDDDTKGSDDTPTIMAPKPIVVNPTGASVALIDNTINLNQFARDTCKSIKTLTGLLASTN